jgi:hypothetical protein
MAPELWCERCCRPLAEHLNDVKNHSWHPESVDAYYQRTKTLVGYLEQAFGSQAHVMGAGVPHVVKDEAQLIIAFTSGMAYLGAVATPVVGRKATPGAMPATRTLPPTPAEASRHKVIGYRVSALKAAVDLYGPTGGTAELVAPEVAKTAELFEQWIARE